MAVNLKTLVTAIVALLFAVEVGVAADSDARGAVACMGNWNGSTCDGTGIDALNRITGKSYSGPGAVTKAVLYCYDGKIVTPRSNPDAIQCSGNEASQERGFLSGVGNLDSRTEYLHDLAGRITKVTQFTEAASPSSAWTKSVEYQFHASDLVGVTKYPSQKQVVECFDVGLRLLWGSATKSLSDCRNGVNPQVSEAYASGAQYTPHGALSEWRLGNGLVERAEFNNRLQMTIKRAGSTGGSSECGVFADDELCLKWSYGTVSLNNGNVSEQRQWIKKSTGGYLNVLGSYGYDSRNRLSSFNESVVSGGSSGGAWGQTSSYDRYGNRWATVSGVTQSDWTPVQQSWIDAGSNRVVTAKNGASGTAIVGFDGAGNMTSHPQVSGTLDYDGEGRLVAGNGAAYVYDGEGRRVKKTYQGGTTFFFYGAGGGLVAEEGGTAQDAGTQYLTTDALGSTRLVTSSTRAVSGRYDYWPFGEEIAGSASYGNRHMVDGYSATANGVKQKFTGKERDAETGLDYFGARYLSAAQGRFTSPDAPFADQHNTDRARHPHRQVPGKSRDNAKNAIAM